MKIAFITNNIAPFRVDLLDQLALISDEVTLYYFNEIDPGVNPRYVEKRPLNAKCICLKNKSIVSRFKTIIENDIVVFDGYSGKEKILLLLCMIVTKHKYFISIDGIIEKNISPNKLKNIIKGSILTHAQCVFSTNSSTDETLRRINKNIIITRHIFTTLSKSDFEYLHRLDVKQIRLSYGIDKNEKVILFVGKYLKTKGIYEMLNCINEKYKYILIGGDLSILNLEENKVPQNVISIPYLEKKDILALMKASNVFVLPTYSDVWGLVIVEALSAGLPVVTTEKCNAGIELIKDGKNGFIIPIRDSQRLTKAIEQALDLNKSDVQTYNHKLMDEYTLENSAKDMYDVFKNKLDGESKV